MAINQAEYREDALRATRSQARKQDIDPTTLSAEEAWEVLDLVYKIDSQLNASVWYIQSSDNQFKLFKAEWNAWKRAMANL